MKSNIKPIKIATATIAALMLILFMSSCEKRTSMEIEKATKVSLKSIEVSNYSLDNIPSREYNNDVDLLLSNPFDKDDEKIKNYLYKLSLATRELIKDANFNKVISAVRLLVPEAQLVRKFGIIFI